MPDLLDRGARHDLERRKRLVARLDLHRAVIEPAVAQLLAQPFARRLLRIAQAGGRGIHDVDVRGRREQEVEQALLGVLPRLRAHVGGALLAHHVDRELDEVAHHRLDVPPDVADFGELRGFHLDEGRLCEPREPSRDLGLSDARRPDHQDVLRRDLLGHFGRQLLPAHPVPERNRDRALGPVLADHVLVELGDDLARRQGIGGEVHDLGQGNRHPAQSSSTTTWVLV